MTEQQKPLSQEDLFNRIAVKAGKTTIMQQSPGGGIMIWVTAAEADPMTALMSCALSIMVRRGHSPDSASGITIRRVTEGIIAPGCEVFWQVTDADGVVIEKGYAKDEQEAAAKIAHYVKPNLKLPTAGAPE